jgi:hypothetical protein
MGGITHVSIDMNALTGKETPNKRSAVRGQRRPPSANPEGVELLRSSDEEATYTPSCAFGLQGVIHI